MVSAFSTMTVVARRDMVDRLQQMRAKGKGAGAMPAGIAGVMPASPN